VIHNPILPNVVTTTAINANDDTAAILAGLNAAGFTVRFAYYLRWTTTTVVNFHRTEGGPGGAIRINSLTGRITRCDIVTGPLTTHRARRAQARAALRDCIGQAHDTTN
jgi:hypothetical protein